MFRLNSINRTLKQLLLKILVDLLELFRFKFACKFRLKSIKNFETFAIENIQHAYKVSS